MIRIRKKTIAPIPAILQANGINAMNVLCNRYEAGERDFKADDFDSKIYGHSEVKEALQNIQYGKCCFCESKIGHISHGDVEHYRPKSGWIQNTEKINKPGYYWLAYEWENLLLCCSKCNQRYKKNYFPLIDPSARVTSHHNDINTEQPLFIHPVLDQVEELITFREEIPVSVNVNLRGSETISKLGLDRELLNEQRRKALNMIRNLYNIAKGIPDTIPSIKQEARRIVLEYVNSSQLDETEYAGMLRAFFRDNPVNF